MSENTKVNQVAAAEILGQQAYVSGKPAAPAMDENLRSFIKNNVVGESIPVLKAWLRGWNNANLCADVQ